MAGFCVGHGAASPRVALGEGALWRHGRRRPERQRRGEHVTCTREAAHRLRKGGNGVASVSCFCANTDPWDEGPAVLVEAGVQRAAGFFV